MASNNHLSYIVNRLYQRTHQALHPRRAKHTLGVLHTALTLAACHGLDPERVSVAALLHDQSKETAPDVIASELAAWGVNLAAEELSFPRIWHGWHAAVWARMELGLNDEEILDAVAHHTAADVNMSPLAKALFVADFCEPLRSIAVAPEIFAEARRDLDEGFHRVLSHKTGHVLAKHSALAPRALRAARQYLSTQEIKRMGLTELVGPLQIQS